MAHHEPLTDYILYINLLDGDLDSLQVLVCTRRAHHHFVLAWYDAHRVGTCIPTLKALTGEVDVYGLAFTHFQLNLLVGFQCFLRTFLVCQTAHIDLYGFQSLSVTSVLYRHAYLIILIDRLADVERSIA